VEILDHANKTLKKIADRYQQNKGITNIPKVESTLKTEKLSEDTVLIEYPGNKIVLKKI